MPGKPGSKRNASVTFRIRVANPPRGSGTRFGVQDKSGDLMGSVATPTGSAVYEVAVDVSERGTGEMPNFLGPFAHGSPGARFLYLSHGTDGGSGWVKRIKLPLSPISWAMIESGAGRALETDVDGRRSGTVHTAWRVAERGNR